MTHDMCVEIVAGKGPLFVDVMFCPMREKHYSICEIEATTAGANFYRKQFLTRRAQRFEEF